MRVPIFLFAAFIVGMSLADLAAFTRSQKRLSADECGAAAAPPSVEQPAEGSSRYSSASSGRTTWMRTVQALRDKEIEVRKQSVMDNLPLRNKWSSEGAGSGQHGGHPTYKDESVLDMCFGAGQETMISTKEVASANLVSDKTVRRARFCVAHTLKEKSYQHIEELIGDAVPPPEFSVIKFSWDETPQRLALAPAELLEFIGPEMWARAQGRLQVVQSKANNFRGSAQAGSLSALTVQIMQRSSHVRFGHDMKYTGSLIHPAKIIETNSAANIGNALCDTSVLTVQFLQKAMFSILCSCYVHFVQSKSRTIYMLVMGSVVYMLVAYYLHVSARLLFCLNIFCWPPFREWCVLRRVGTLLLRLL